MKDKRPIKIINDLTGEIIEVKSYNQAKEKIHYILLDLIEEHTNQDLTESITYININNLTIIRNYYTEEENSSYKAVYTISDQLTQVKDPYSIY